MYLADSYLETKSKLLYFLKDRSASIYLYGPIGSGKTSLLRLIAEELDQDKAINAQYIITPNLKTSNQLLRRFCDAFDVKTERSYEASLKNFEEFLIAQAKANRFPLLLVDEAQNLTKDSLKLVHYLLNFCSNEKVLVMFVLVGQPELLERIAKFPSLKSRMISANISEMTRRDQEAMIKFRWGITSDTSVPFTTKALDTIYSITKGNPRKTIKLCDLALVHGLTENQKKIKASLIKKGAKDL